MSDVCDALAESARLLRSLAAQDASFNTIWIGPSKRAADDAVFASSIGPQGPSVHDLATRLEGGYVEIKRLRLELARMQALGTMERV